jgi:hypothetical protein
MIIRKAPSLTRHKGRRATGSVALRQPPVLFCTLDLSPAPATIHPMPPPAPPGTTPVGTTTATDPSSRPRHARQHARSFTQDMADGAKNETNNSNHNNNNNRKRKKKTRLGSTIFNKCWNNPSTASLAVVCLLDYQLMTTTRKKRKVITGEKGKQKQQSNK